MQDSPNIRVIDITHAARPWRWVRLADYAMVILCTYLFIHLLIAEIVGPHSAFVSLVFMPLLMAAAALNLYAGWLIIGVISLRHHWIATLALTLLVAFGLLIFFVGLLLLRRAGNNEQTIDRGIFDAGEGVFLVFSASIGIVGLLRIRWSKIRDLKISLKDLLAEIDRLGREQPPPGRLPPRNRARGLISGFGGLGILSGMTAMPDVGTNALSFATPFGWYLLLQARAYFQPDFEHLIAADTRRPILFLRSFADDQVLRYSGSERMFIDFSLESRLANYFHDFGPFIAVGSTKKSGIELGAARVQLSDDEWQAKVLNWMQTSSVIVLFAGLTPWVNWELKEAVTGRNVNKLLVLFPGSHQHWWQRGRSDAERRLDAIRKDLADTVWSAALDQLDSPITIRAITLAPSGRITVIRSRTRIRDSYHLAAIVAHFLMLTAPTSGSKTHAVTPGIAV